MAEISLAGGRVHATVSGDGAPLVLLHSLLADATSFDRVTGPLARNFRVVVPDLPGFGGSAVVDVKPAEARNGLAAIADRMALALAEIGDNDRLTLLGNGYGGFVALTLAIRHPHLLGRLVMADSGAAFSEPGRQAFRNMAGAARAKGLDAVADTAMRRLFAPDYQDAHPELIAERRARFLSMDPAVFEAACEALANLDLRPDLAGVLSPVLAVVGEQDEATPAEMSRELVSLLADARYVPLPGLAHVPQLQDPAAFLAAVDPFLAASPAKAVA